MGCKTCGPQTQGQCDVCLLCDGDESFKVVVFCGTCDAYICKPCEKNWLKRAEAYFKRKLGL